MTAFRQYPILPGQNFFKSVAVNHPSYQHKGNKTFCSVINLIAYVITGIKEGFGIV